MFWDYQPLIMVIRPQGGCLKLQIPYYHPLNLWLLWATRTPSTYPLRVPPPRNPSAYPSMYPLCIPPPRTPSAYPLCIPPPRTPSCVPPPRTPSAYPLHVPPLRTPSHVPEWIWLVNVPTTANQITGIEKANYHKILIFFPTTSLKSLFMHARIDQLADSNEPLQLNNVMK